MQNSNSLPKPPKILEFSTKPPPSWGKFAWLNCKTSQEAEYCDKHFAFNHSSDVSRTALKSVISVFSGGLLQNAQNSRNR